MYIELVLVIAAFLLLPPPRKPPPAPVLLDRARAGAMIGPKRKAEREREIPRGLVMRESAQRTMAGAGLGAPLALRCAIVLTTVLGPCRAASPHGSPVPGSAAWENEGASPAPTVPKIDGKALRT